jgi:DNA-directed RNA polymerase subunit M/transcription elongation factor TFIIS
MNLLNNAIQSIQVGVADYRDGSPARLLAAVRNIHAGILLLYKEALRRKSPAGSNEVLLKQRMLPRFSKEQLYFVGQGKKTVDVQQIKERFESLDIVTDWKRFDAIGEVRNDIEHYYTATNQSALRHVIADAFIIIRNFLTDELEEDPHSLLGDHTWQELLQVEEVHTTELAECRRVLEGVPWESDVLATAVCEIGCTKCGSDLLTLTSDRESVLRCRACGAEEPSEEFIPRAIQEHYAFDARLALAKCGEMPFTHCPHCGAHCYMMEEQKCALCLESAVHKCIRCGNAIPAEELALSPLCGRCAHMAEKDD